MAMGAEGRGGGAITDDKDPTGLAKLWRRLSFITPGEKQTAGNDGSRSGCR